ncbi:MAG TPA: hypothetical protein VES42_05950 [Pilimelia sp.]|nr:hypothetical protein [Pilimelia sp.]
MADGDDPRAATVADAVWNEISPADYESPGERYRAAVLDQYKTYLELADRISARRAIANSFFLTVNTAAFTALGISWRVDPAGSDTWLLVPLVGLLGLCGAWYALVRSYRQLNASKYLVIAALEARLPAAPSRAEWAALRQRGGRRRYVPLTSIEQFVPGIIAGVYVLAVLAVLS